MGSARPARTDVAPANGSEQEGESLFLSIWCGRVFLKRGVARNISDPKRLWNIPVTEQKSEPGPDLSGPTVCL